MRGRLTALLLALLSLSAAPALADARTDAKAQVDFGINVAQRFRIPPGKGQISVAADADLALADTQQTFEVKSQDLFYRHAQTPYLGRALTGKVIQTILRGKTIFKDGKVVSKPMGRLVKPTL